MKEEIKNKIRKYGASTLVGTALTFAAVTPSLGTVALQINGGESKVLEDTMGGTDIVNKIVENFQPNQWENIHYTVDCDNPSKLLGNGDTAVSVKNLDELHKKPCTTYQVKVFLKDKEDVVVGAVAIRPPGSSDEEKIESIKRDNQKKKNAVFNGIKPPKKEGISDSDVDSAFAFGSSPTSLENLSYLPVRPLTSYEKWLEEREYKMDWNLDGYPDKLSIVNSNRGNLITKIISGNPKDSGKSVTYRGINGIRAHFLNTLRFLGENNIPSSAIHENPSPYTLTARDGGKEVLRYLIETNEVASNIGDVRKNDWDKNEYNRLNNVESLVAIIDKVANGHVRGKFISDKFIENSQKGFKSNYNKVDGDHYQESIADYRSVGSFLLGWVGSAVYDTLSHDFMPLVKADEGLVVERGGAMHRNAMALDTYLKSSDKKNKIEFTKGLVGVVETSYGDAKLTYESKIYGERNKGGSF